MPIRKDIMDDGIRTPFTPINDLPSCALWLDAGLDVVETSGRVADWLDQSTYGHDATQGTHAARPVLVASDANFNNRPSLRFDGAQTMTLGLPAPLDITPNTDAISIFAIALRDTAAVGSHIFITQGEGDASSVQNWTIRANKVEEHFETIVGGTKQIGADGDWTAGQAMVYGLVSPGAGTNFHSYIDGVSLRNMAPGSNAIAGNVVVGANGHELSGFLDGSIAEIFVCLADLTSYVSDIQTYAAWKYGI